MDALITWLVRSANVSNLFLIEIVSSKVSHRNLISSRMYCSLVLANTLVSASATSVSPASCRMVTGCVAIWSLIQLALKAKCRVRHVTRLKVGPAIKVTALELSHTISMECFKPVSWSTTFFKCKASCNPVAAPQTLLHTPARP